MPHSERIGRCLFYVFVFSAVQFLAGCQKEVVFDASFAQDDVPLPVIVMPSDSLNTIYDGLSNRRAVVGFYEINERQPAWIASDEGGDFLGDSLIRFIQGVRYFGLLPQDYHLKEITAVNPLWWRPEVQLRRDALLTDAFLSLANDLRNGRLRTPASDHDSISLSYLLRALSERRISEILEDAEPDFAQYLALKEALHATLEQGDSLARSLLMRGITLDSVTLHDKVRLIEINLERWRWEQGAWGDRYIYVNIPSFTLQVMDEDTTALESRVIVGRPEKATPEFSSVVQCFVTYPYWHVPRKISVEELLPKIQRDTSFVRRNNFDVLDRRGNLLDPDSVEWQKFHMNHFPVILRQREGPENSLGVIKFVFDNPYAVFVHDTNARRLFRNTNRALSHGCIRIETATALGHYLVTGNCKNKSDLLNSFLEQKLRHTIDLSHPIPIHIRYFTASAQNGSLVFLPDIYSKDRALIDRFYDVAPLLSKR